MWLSAARDVAIILLAFESLVIGGLLVFLLFEIRRLVRLLEEEIKPLAWLDAKDGQHCPRDDQFCE